MKQSRFGQWCSGVFILALMSVSVTATANSESTIWQNVASGKNLVIMRHALAPGSGDPANFDLEHCNTQRNLSTAGIEQAARIGAMFNARGISTAQVYTSQWCRCVDTASAMNLGTAEALPALNSFYNDREKMPAQMQALRQWLANLQADGPVIMVTHQVVISALTDAYPTSGEAVVFQLRDNGSVEVVHRETPK